MKLFDLLDSIPNSQKIVIYSIDGTISCFRFEVDSINKKNGEVINIEAVNVDGVPVLKILVK